MRIFRGIVLGITICIVAAGCVDDSARPISDEGGGTSSAAVPDWKPISDANRTKLRPRGLSKEPDWHEVISASDSPGGMINSEEFAILLGQALIDRRTGNQVVDNLDRVASVELSGPARAFILEDAATQKRLGSQRTWRVDRGIWIRSQTIAGTQKAPRRLAVEIAAPLVSEPLEYRGWYKTRIDVVREGHKWLISDFRAGDTGPFTDDELSAAERREWLTGAGWRRAEPRDDRARN